MRYLLVITFLCLFTYQGFSQNKQSFATSDSTFLLNGKTFQIISGEIHYPRVPAEYWRDRMKKAKAMGLNTISTYVFWNIHEPEKGVYDFKNNHDIAKFLQIAKEEGLWVVLRPSPYVCAEWEFGGYPYWLLKDTTLKVRSTDPKFIQAYSNYVQVLAKQIKPYLITNGGNVVMIQIENEYGSYNLENEKQYMKMNRDLFIKAGFDCLLYTCDPPRNLYRGYLPGTMVAVNGMSKPAEIRELVNKYNGGKGPYFVSEWYPGWFDIWGKPHKSGNADEDAAKLDTVLKAGISINMYMFHGGTTRNFLNGANMNHEQGYSPQISSYDYDAPLDEAGNVTDKYLKFRKVILNNLTDSSNVASVPTKSIAKPLGKIALTKFSSVFSNLPAGIAHKSPLNFEALNQDYGYILYTHLASEDAKGLMKFEHIRDFAIFYINGKNVGHLDRRLNQDSIYLEIKKGDKLSIFVENCGRLNSGPFLTDNRKGIYGSLTLAGKPVENWNIYQFPFKTLASIKFAKDTFMEGSPTFYQGKFKLSKPTDTYLDLRNFKKGFVFVNGHNLGRYWEIGPQQTIYLPKCWLKKGNNLVEIFDQFGSNQKWLNTLDYPILNEVK